MNVTLKVNRAGFNNIMKKINTLKTDVTDKSFFTRIGHDVVRIAQGYAPISSGDTLSHISMVLANSKQVRIQSTSTNPKFPGKHLWINKIKGYEIAPDSKMRYDQVGTTGDRRGYWNLAFKESIDTVGTEVQRRIAKIIES